MTSMTAGARAVVACALLVAGCKEESSSVVVPSGDAIVARIDGQPVLASEVQLHLGEAPPRIGTAPPIDPQRAALDAALRVRLFAQEGRRRGIAAKGAPAIVQATLVRGVIDAETAGAMFRADGISDEEARLYYEGDPKRFNRPTEVRVAAVAFDDLRAAEALLVKAAAASEAEFAELGGKELGVVDEHGDGVDPKVGRTASRLKEPGAVGLATGEDGRHYVLRATAVSIVMKPWNADVMRIKHFIVEERRNEALRKLEDRLRKGVSIQIDEKALAQVTKSEA